MYMYFICFIYIIYTYTQTLPHTYTHIFTITHTRTWDKLAAMLCVQTGVSETWSASWISHKDGGSQKISHERVTIVERHKRWVTNELRMQSHAWPTNIAAKLCARTGLSSTSSASRISKVTNESQIWTVTNESQRMSYEYIDSRMSHKGWVTNIESRKCSCEALCANWRVGDVVWHV